MAIKKKKPIEKFETKLKNLLKDPIIDRNGNKIKIRNKIFFEFDEKSVKYGKRRYYPNLVKDIVEEDYTVEIILSEKSLGYFSSNLINPPKAARLIIDTFKKLFEINFSDIKIGARKNEIVNGTICITSTLYSVITKINKEERSDKVARFKNRVIPFINNEYNVSIELVDSKIDYSLLLSEFLQSGEFVMQDIFALSDKISPGLQNKLLIKNQITKQSKWLIDTIQDIIDTIPLKSEKAKELGKKYFHYTKASISGPEHLLEKILSDYGRNIIFGVPFLINTNKYVQSKNGLPRSQFDLILVDHLADIQVVELKRSDKYVMNFDPGRGKFYASKDLSIAISQAERYISAVNRDNDEEYLIDNKKLRDYLNELISGQVTIDVCRPSAIIIIGTAQTISPNYHELSQSIRKRFTEEDYYYNSMQAYKELKNSFKNIQISTYTEIIDTARLRLTEGQDNATI